MVPPIDIGYVASEARRLCEELAQGCADADESATAGLDPDGLCVALHGVLTALDQADPAAAGRPTTAAAPDLGTLGDHGMDLLGRLTALAGRLRLPQHARQVEALALPLAVWIARRGGELGHPAPVANAAAALANSLRAPEDLAGLYGLMTEVVDALSPQIAQDRDASDATRPWRVLLLNRAIVATRSHRPHLMQAAFAAVVEALPGDAPEFFREAMGQMDALNYPPQVRAVVQHYVDAWCSRRTLH
jgi:hypothetical protein